MNDYLKGFRYIGVNARLLMAVSFFAYAGIGVYSVIFNLYLVQLGFREDFIGAFQALSVLGTGALAIPTGVLSNRIGHKWTLLIGLVLLVISSVAQTLVTEVAILLFSGFLNGVSLACIVVPLTPLLAEVSTERERSHLFSANYANISLATTIGSLIGGQLPVVSYLMWSQLSSGSIIAYRFALLVGAAITVLAIFPILFVRQREIHTPGTRTAANVPKEAISERRSWQNIRVLALAMALIGLGSALVIPFYNVYLSEVLHAPTENVGYVFALANTFAAICSLATPVLHKRFGATNSISWVRIATIPMFVALAFAPAIGLAILAYVVRMTFMSMSWPLEQTLVMSSVTIRHRATAIGLRSAAWNLCWAGASFVAGYLIVRLGYAAMFLANGGLVFAGVLLQHVYFRRVSRLAAARPEVAATVATAIASAQEEPADIPVQPAVAIVPVEAPIEAPADEEGGSG